MTFTPGIPASGQSLGSSRPQVLNNFAVLRSTIATNHIDVNSTGAGKHNFSEYVVQAQSPATATGEIATYCRSVSGTPQLFLQKENQIAAATDIQMSRLDKGIMAATDGFSFLPGGLIIQWGRLTPVPSSGVQTITFPTPFTTACYSVTFSPAKTTPITNIFATINGEASVTTSQFQVLISGSGGFFDAILWMAIGK